MRATYQDYREKHDGSKNELAFDGHRKKTDWNLIQIGEFSASFESS
jgi:hypothetical protein